MSYHYSSFISYRRNHGDDEFIRKFKNLIESEAAKVTNKPEVFFDGKSIEWGEEFDDKIYDAIVACYFFIPFYHNSYLHESNLWCAKELYRAIEVEKKIRESIENYCFILPIIDRGAASAFPECLGRKNAKNIKKYRHLILKKTTSKALEDLKYDIYDIFLKNFDLLDNKSIKELCDDIVIPTDEEIIEWIKEQKAINDEHEAHHLPRLTKNDD